MSKNSKTSDQESQCSNSSNHAKKKIKKDKVKKKDKKKKDKKKKKDQKNKFGKYGLITMQDIFNKKEEFTIWLMEIKKINIETISHSQERNLFGQFVEDYNTCTFPSKKYYNYNYFLKKQSQKSLNQQFQDDQDFIFNDEADKERERLAAKNYNKQMEIHKALYNLNNEEGKVNQMNDKQHLIDKMHTMYKMGNLAEAQKIQKILDIKKNNSKLDERHNASVGYVDDD